MFAKHALQMATGATMAAITRVHTCTSAQTSRTLGGCTDDELESEPKPLDQANVRIRDNRSNDWKPLWRVRWSCAGAGDLVNTDQTRALVDEARASLNLVGDGDWTPQDGYLARTIVALRAAVERVENLKADQDGLVDQPGRVRIVSEGRLVREIANAFHEKLVFGRGGSRSDEPSSQLREAQLFLGGLKDRGVIQ